MRNTFGDIWKQVQAAFQDPDVRALLASQDLAKLQTHPTLAVLLRDPEVAALCAQIDPNALLNG